LFSSAGDVLAGFPAFFGWVLSWDDPAGTKISSIRSIIQIAVFLFICFPPGNLQPTMFNKGHRKTLELQSPFP
jgi:hypothetical protein